MIKTRQKNGFTLIELMIVVAIIGILAAIAYPSYTESVRKSNRSDAFVALQEMAQRQESYFLRNYSYAKDLIQLGYPATSAQGLYSLSVASITPAGCAGTQASSCSSFTLSAVAASGKTQAHDSSCQTLTLSNRGTKAAKDSSGNASTVCW
jgi:type IV pilus assembly protein PilE